MPSPRLAPSLVALRAELKRTYPNRDTHTDGWLGDAAHRARKSEHNPDLRGVVHALDIDTTPGLTKTQKKALLRSLVGDDRVWYVIHDGVIWSRNYGWRARRYTGSNPHVGHVHVSIRLTQAAERDKGKWLDAGVLLPGVRAARMGDRGADVRWAQRRINRALAGADGAGLVVDGRFGRRTYAAVRAYQRRAGLPVSGVLDKATWRALK